MNLRHFDQLSTFPYEKRLSKIDTLNLAISFLKNSCNILFCNINMLEAIIANDDETFRFFVRAIRKAKLNKSLEYSSTIWGTCG
uniref:BHLH domain-containing protein n=1 Tax=Meloidogyne incognita TaxID=6306 RepID=A0A914NNQ2_MELIC